MKVHILDDWFDTLRGLPCFSLLTGLPKPLSHEVKVWTDRADESTLAERLKEAEALVLFRERTKITRSLLEQLPNLKLISGRGAYPHVDISACTDNGVLFCSKLPKAKPADTEPANTAPADTAPATTAPPDSAAGQDDTNYAAAELTFALILCAMRQLPWQMESVKAGRWQMGVGRSLRGRVLGLYGYGRISRAVGTYGRAFGMYTQFWASEGGLARARADGVSVPPNRESFFGSSDVVSLHVRLVPATRGVITATDLAQMRANSVLVNTSRAGVIESGALLAALNAGSIGTAALDVFDTEPLTDPNDLLLSHPRVIATPHIGFVTEDEFDKQFTDIFEQINAYARGEPMHVINAELLG